MLGAPYGGSQGEVLIHVNGHVEVFKTHDKGVGCKAVSPEETSNDTVVKTRNMKRQKTKAGTQR